LCYKTMNKEKISFIALITPYFWLGCADGSLQ
jgi:hypothetical protein